MDQAVLLYVLMAPDILFSFDSMYHFFYSYVIYPIQVLAKSCKPVPVMLMGALLGKKYPLRKYLNVVMIVMGVALFMGGGSEKKKASPDVVDTTSANANDDADADDTSSSQIIGIVLLFLSLCFDGGTGAYEDKLMSVHSVQPFDLMYNIQLGKTILAFIGLLVLNELHIFIQMVQEMGFLLVALGLSGALGQVFIFVTIAKFGALTCSIIGLSRKVTTLVASIYFYGHHLNSVQFTGLLISVTAMVMNFWGKKKGGDGGHGDPPPTTVVPEEMEKMLDDDDEPREDDGDLEFAALPSPKELV
jgi:UDP-galactose transporter B1